MVATDPQIAKSRFNARTIKWCWVIGLTAIITITTMLVTGRQIGSPELFVVTAGTLVLSWLIVGIIKSRGKFRIISILVLCTIVALLSSYLSPRMRTAAAHRRLFAEVIAAGGSCHITQKQFSVSQGWAMTRKGRCFPSVLIPLVLYLDGGEVDRLTVPVDIITKDFAKHVRFSNHPGVKFQMRGTTRDVEAVAAFAERLRKDHRVGIEVECFHLIPEDTILLSRRMRAVWIAMAGNLTPDQLQIAISAKPRVIIWQSGAVINESEWKNARLHFQSEISFSLRGVKCPESFLDAITSHEYPLHIELLGCQLSDLAWTKLFQIDLAGLSVNGSSPTEDQLLRMLQLKNLKYLTIIEPFIGDKCLQELSKVATLEQLFIDVNEKETLRCFLRNNPKLLLVNFPTALLEDGYGLKYSFCSRSELIKRLDGQETQSAPKN